VLVNGINISEGILFFRKIGGVALISTLAPSRVQKASATNTGTGTAVYIVQSYATPECSTVPYHTVP